MKRTQCAVCGGQLLRKVIQYDQHWGDQIVIFEDVPAQVCMVCGEVWLNSKIVKTMDKVLTGEQKPTRRKTVPVWSFAAIEAA